jgi:hypothetical protein
LRFEEKTQVQENQWRLWIPGGRHQWVDFGVERHNLVIGKIIQIFHRFATAILQVQIASVHFIRVRAQVLGDSEV